MTSARGLLGRTARLATLALALAGTAAACTGLDAPDGADATAGAAPSPGAATPQIWAPAAGAHRTDEMMLWEQVPASISSRYALTSTAVGSPAKTMLRLFYRDASGCLHHLLQYDGAASWSPDATLAMCGEPGFDGDVAAIAWSLTRYDLFWLETFLAGSNPHLHHLFWNGSAWLHEDLGATATAGATDLAVGSWGDGHIDVFWRDATSAVRRRRFDWGRKNTRGFDANGWQLTDTVALPYGPSTRFAVAAPAVDELAIAYRNGGGTLTIQRSNDSGASWTTHLTGVAIDGPPALASWGPGSLMALGRRAADTARPFRQITRVDGTWTDVGFPSPVTANGLVAAASPGRAHRLDVLASPTGASLHHTFYQESLPGFAELPNPQPSWWCWADAGGMIVNYLAQDTAGWAPQTTCQFASVTLGENCCGAIADPDCYQENKPNNVFDAYGVTWADKDIFTFDEIRAELGARHRPILIREAHNHDGGGHFIVIREAYRFRGVEYVAVADPGDDGQTWVWPYQTLLDYDENWHVDFMERGFALAQ